jgi:hypothetical protein
LVSSSIPIGPALKAYVLIVCDNDDDSDDDGDNNDDDGDDDGDDDNDDDSDDDDDGDDNDVYLNSIHLH